MLIKLFTLYVYLQAAFCGCSADSRNSDFVRLRKEYTISIEKIGRLDPRIKESSGLAHATDSTFWTHPDGGASELYQFSLEGELVRTAPLPIPNTDWEDLAQQKGKRLFIGNFGNNGNQRRDLKVYSVSSAAMRVTDTISFRFADQVEFPPPRSRQHYDLEAFFYHQDSLYLFTKSRALQPITQLYKLPVSGSEQELQPVATLRVKSPVTAADISPDTSLFALLGYGRLYLFEQAAGSIDFKGRRYCLPVGRTGQAEAVLFLSSHQLLISNEKGKLYLVTLQPKKDR